MSYLSPAEYAVYGLSAETSDALVAAASGIIDAFCRRPSLLVTTYVERVRVNRERQTVRLTNLPVVSVDGVAPAVTACRVRTRRMGGTYATALLPQNVYDITPLQQAAQVFGLSGTWTSMDPATVVVYANGEVELPPNLFGVPYDEAEVTYTAGFAAAPAPVKSACAQIVRNANATPALNVKKQSIDAMDLEYFGPSLLDDEVKRVLRPYLSARLG